MSTTTKPSFSQPALVGGVVIGVLSALPLISAGNWCCCLWVVGGGAVAAYLLQQNQVTPVMPGDGALVGLLAGLVGAFVYLVLSIPITILIGPTERVLVQRMIEAGGMPPEYREYAGTVMGGGFQIALGFISMLIVGGIFSTLGGLLGAIIFTAPARPGPVDASDPSA